MSTKRQLAAIMFTDIVGYTALMGKDSKKALEIVRKSRQIQKPLVEKHNGQWLKEMGDGAMAQFSTALDAVNCAIEIQRYSQEELEAKLRIGIHLGDITIENNDIYGDGVNVASRLESIADPGGVYISESIEKAIRGQSTVQSKFLGEIHLKNVDYGVRTYALQGDGLPLPKVKEDKIPSGGFFAQLKQRVVTRTGIIYILISITLIAILGQFAYNKYWNNGAIDASIIERSIAVIPFENRSNLEEDAFFTDGFHDDLLTQISKIREIKTISRTSVMEYRNTTKKIGTIGEELGVATILEGGVQRSGNQIRINIRLIDVKTNAFLWAETYTRELNAENIFVIQSEISQAIAAALATILSPEEKQDLSKLPTQNLAALEAYFHAKESSNKRTIEGYQAAIDYLQDAVKLDPSFAIAYAKLGRLTLDKFWWSGLPIKEQIVKGKSFIEMAMQLDSTISEVQMANGYLKSYEKDVRKGELFNYADYDKDLHAIELAYQKAIDLNPNNATAYAFFGNHYLSLGKKAQGIEYLFKAKELDPLDYGLGINLAIALRKSNRFEESRQIGEEIIASKPDFAHAYGTLAAVAFFGDHKLAESLRLLHKMNTLNPSYQANYIAWNYDHLGDKERTIAWYKHALLISPSKVQAVIARGTIYKFDGEYNKAYETYLKGTATVIPGGTGQILMFRLTEMGVETNRSNEVIEHYRKKVPNLFQSDVVIDENNFIMAFALGRLLKAKGEYVHSDYLFKESLKIAQMETSQVPQNKENNWEGRIYLAMGNNEASLASFIKLVEEGIHSDLIVRDPVYQPLYDEPEFQRGMGIMKTRLEEERAIVKQMEARGELDIPPLPDN